MQLGNKPVRGCIACGSGSYLPSWWCYGCIPDDEHDIRDDFDPPYYLGDASYNENDGWNENKEKELLEYLNKVNKHGIKFALSNVTEHKGLKNEILIDWAIENQYNIHNLNYNYSNSNYHLKDKNQITKEVLITNY